MVERVARAKRVSSRGLQLLIQPEVMGMALLLAPLIAAMVVVEPIMRQVPLVVRAS
jgi:hypothetical protein